MKREQVVLPKTEEDRKVIRNHPEKMLAPPVYSKQKTGIIFYAVMLLLLIAVLITGILLNDDNWSLYLFMCIPLIQMHMESFLNLFAVTDNGILSGKGFFSWNKIKSFQFVPIDINHRYYGYAQDVNNTYEMKIKTTFQTVSCVVTTEEMKERLRELLREHADEIKNHSEAM